MDRVKIGKENRPVCFGWNALAEYEKLTGQSLLQFSNREGLSVGNTIKLVYVGLLYGAKKDEVKADFTIEDVGDWLTDNPTVVAEIIDVFVKSMPDVGKKK